jgi:hypothetical protein
VLRHWMGASVLGVLLLAGCGGGGGGGDGDAPDPGGTPAAATGTPASASFPAAAAFSAYNATARQQSFTLSPFGFCLGSATLTDSAPAAATFEGAAAKRKTTIWTLQFTNCVPDSNTTTTEVFLDANNAQIGEVRAGVGYTVLHTPLMLPASVKVGDSGTLADASIFTDSTRTTSAGTVVYSYEAEADTRVDSIVVRITASTRNTVGQVASTESRMYHITSAGAMELTSGSLTRNGRRLIF